MLLPGRWLSRSSGSDPTQEDLVSPLNCGGTDEDVSRRSLSACFKTAVKPAFTPSEQRLRKISLNSLVILFFFYFGIEGLLGQCRIRLSQRDSVSSVFMTTIIIICLFCVCRAKLLGTSSGAARKNKSVYIQCSKKREKCTTLKKIQNKGMDGRVPLPFFCFVSILTSSNLLVLFLRWRSPLRPVSRLYFYFYFFYNRRHSSRACILQSDHECKGRQVEEGLNVTRWTLHPECQQTRAVSIKFNFILFFLNLTSKEIDNHIQVHAFFNRSDDNFF